jgi:ribonuclease-3
MLARKIGIGNIVQYDQKNSHLQQVILGNTLEAIVGAVYLDKGYLRTKKFVIDKLIGPNYDLDELVNSNSNFKSKIIEWAQREGKEVRFVIVNTEPLGTGYGNSKKKAEQDAALKTCEMLNLLDAG